jgi:hypothetical protein
MMSIKGALACTELAMRFILKPSSQLRPSENHLLPRADAGDGHRSTPTRTMEIIRARIADDTQVSSSGGGLLHKLCMTAQSQQS